MRIVSIFLFPFLCLITLNSCSSNKRSKDTEEISHEKKTIQTKDGETLVAQEDAPRSKETYKRLSSCEQYIGLPFIDLERQKGKGNVHTSVFEDNKIVSSVFYTENWFGMDRLSEYVIHPKEQVVEKIIVHCDGYSRKDAINKVAKILGNTDSNGKGEKNTEISYFAHWRKNALWYEVQEYKGKIRLVMSKYDYKVRNQF